MDHTIEYTVIGCYLAFLIAIGWVFHRLNSNVSDYFRSGSRGTWWLVGMSAFMAGISAYSFTGAASVAFDAGWAIAIIYIGNSAGYLVNVLFTAAWFRQLRATTAPEVIRMRFGPVTQQLYAVSGMVVSIFYSALTLLGVAVFTASIFGYPLTSLILVLGVVTLVYSLVGGSWGVMAGDFVQGMIMLPMTILITILCLVEVGGVGGFFNLVQARGLGEEFSILHPSGRFPLEQFTVVWAIAMVLKQTWELNMLGSAPKFFAVKDGRDARKAAGLALVLSCTGVLFWFIPPMTARLLWEEQTLAMPLNTPSEAAFAVASLRLLPPGLIGLMVVAMFSATLSTLDVGLNRNAAIAMRDIYPALCRLLRRSPGSQRWQLALSRLMTGLFGALIVMVAVYYATRSDRGMFAIMLDLGAMIGLPLAVPMLLGMFVRRVPWWSALLSIAAGLAASIFAAVDERTWTFQQKVFTVLGAGCGAFVLTRLFWSTATGDYRQRVEQFFTTMHTPVDFEKEVGTANDHHQLRLIGGFVLAMGCFIACLLAVPADTRGRLSTLFVAATVVLTGLLMLYASRRARRRTALTTPSGSAASTPVDAISPVLAEARS